MQEYKCLMIMDDYPYNNGAPDVPDRKYLPDYDDFNEDIPFGDYIDD